MAYRIRIWPALTSRKRKVPDRLKDCNLAEELAKCICDKSADPGDDAGLRTNAVECAPDACETRWVRSSSPLIPLANEATVPLCVPAADDAGAHCTSKLVL